MRIQNRELGIPPDQIVFCVVYDDVEDDLGDLWMPDIYSTLESAKEHWRFNAGWLEAEEKAHTRIESIPYIHAIKKCFSPEKGFNPTHARMNINFISKYLDKWNAKDQVADV